MLWIFVILKKTQGFIQQAVNGEQPDQVCVFRKLGCRVGDKLERRRRNTQNPLRGKLNPAIESRVSRVRNF